VASTEKRAVAMVTRNGGRMEGDTLVVKTQAAKPPKLEVWDDYGSPVERIPVDDKRWTWSEGWSARRDAPRGTAQKGAEFSVTFQGTGAILAGPYLASGGKADVYLDGKLHSTVDAFSDESGSKGDEAVWHAFKLPNRTHVLRLVVRGEPFPGSKGSDIGIQDLVVFR
jgi:hypothetical protein